MQELLKPVFKEERTAGDKCIVTLVDAALKHLGHKDPKQWKENNTIKEALTKEPKLQIFLINRYWREQLGKLAISTTYARFALVDEVETAEYLSLFKTQVAPLIVNNGI